MPPEQIRNFRDVRPQSDIYAVGMTAYSLLAGEIALNLTQKSSMVETIKAILNTPPSLYASERLMFLRPIVKSSIRRLTRILANGGNQRTPGARR